MSTRDERYAAWMAQVPDRFIERYAKSFAANEAAREWADQKMKESRAKVRSQPWPEEAKKAVIPAAPKRRAAYDDSLDSPERSSDSDYECSMYEADRFTDGHDPSDNCVRN